MKIVEVKERSPKLIVQLFRSMGKPVKATHLFLSESEIKSIKEYVSQALKAITHLIIAEDENGVPVAFMGVELETLEMLFIAPEEHGKGLGKRLFLQPGFSRISCRS